MANEVQTTIPVPALDSAMGSARLHLSTDKSSGGYLYSAASVHFINAQGCITFEVFGDFRKVCAKRDGKATQKNLDALHADTFTPEKIELLKAAALAYYANR